MRFSAAAVCAFAAIIAKDLTQQAIAAPYLLSEDEPPKAENSNVTETVPAKPVNSIALPEQFSEEISSKLPPEQNSPTSSQEQIDESALEDHSTSLTPSITSSTSESAFASVATTDDRVHQTAPVSTTVNITPPEIILESTDSSSSPLTPSNFSTEVTQAIEVEVEDLRGVDPVAPAEPAEPAQPVEPPVSPPADDTASSTLDRFAPPVNPLLTPTQPAEVETREVVPITLDQALELARRNSPELQVAALELERTEAALREAQAANLPTVDASADLTLQQSANQFGSSVDTLLGGNLEMNYDLYTSGRRSALIGVAEQQIRAQELQVEIIAETVELDVIDAYYGLQQADQQVRITQAAVAEAERSLRDATALELAGVGTLFDRLQTEVDVANARQELTLALSQQQTARRQLRQQLNIAESIGVSAADPVEIAGTWNSSLEESILLAYRNRAELEQQLVQREINQQQRRVALADLGPQVSLFANLGVQNSFIQGAGLRDDFQMGARLRLSLFDGGAARARAAQEAANIAIAETQFSDIRSQIRLEVESAYLALQSNSANAQTATQAVATAAEALRLARLRFQAGVGTQTDVSRLQTELTRAEVNRLQTILGYNRALASLQRAVDPLNTLGEG